MSDDLFLHIKQPKKRAILQAALAEFAARGFDSAGTRSIAARAGVAHSLVFYYFKDKEALFTHLMDCCLGRLSQVYIDSIEPEQDYITRMYCIMKVKLEQYAKYPEVYGMFMDAHFEYDSSVGIKLERMRQRFSANIIPLMVATGDNDRFRDDIDVGLAKKVVNAAFNGLGDGYLSAYKQGHLTLEQLLKQGSDEGRRYVDLLQRILYKEPPLQMKHKLPGGK